MRSHTRILAALVWAIAFFTGISQAALFTTTSYHENGADKFIWQFEWDGTLPAADSAIFAPAGAHNWTASIQIQKLDGINKFFVIRTQHIHSAVPSANYPGPQVVLPIGVGQLYSNVSTPVWLVAARATHPNSSPYTIDEIGLFQLSNANAAPVLFQMQGNQIVPEPASAVALACGLAGLVGIFFRQRHS